jgi:hypothetical protein
MMRLLTNPVVSPVAHALVRAASPLLATHGVLPRPTIASPSALKPPKGVRMSSDTARTNAYATITPGAEV